jgi:hypothetical protein
VAALRRVGERDDDDVADARGDLLPAARAAVGLQGGVGLDRPDLGGPPGERVTDEHGGDVSRTFRARTGHEALSPPRTRDRAHALPIRYNVAVGIVTVGVRFGLSAPEGSGPSPDGDVGAVVCLAVAAERAGADAVLVDRGRGPVDPFVVLGALAAVTDRALLGWVATPVDERHPAVLAKTVAALDVCSEGRALACLRAGARRPRGGLDELGEALDVVRLMLEVPAPTYAGRHFSVSGAWNEPRSRRTTPVPVGVLVPAVHGAPPFAAGDLVDVAVRHANCCFVEFGAGDRRQRDVTRRIAVPNFPVVAIVGVGKDASPGAVARAAARALDHGCGGVVLDWRRAPTPGFVTETVAAVGAVVRRDVIA